MKWIVMMSLVGGFANKGIESRRCVKEFDTKAAAESWLNAQAPEPSKEIAGCDLTSAEVFESKPLTVKWKKKTEKYEIEVIKGVVLE